MIEYTPENAGTSAARTGPLVESGLAALVIMFGYLERQADVDRLRHELGHSAEASVEDLVRLGKREGLRARAVPTDWHGLTCTAPPAIAALHEGYVMLGRIDDDRALVQEPATGKIEMWSRTEFEARYAGRLILLTSRERVAGPDRRFDVSWFIPALVRYRRLLGEVFLAPILVVVPNGAELVIDAQVLNRDIGFVRAGQAVTVKLEAYPFIRYGTLEGRLAWVSRDAIQDEKLGPVYQARVTVRPPTGAAARLIRIGPGLQATAEIRTDERRVIDYLLSPLERRLSEAARER